MLARNSMYNYNVKTRLKLSCSIFTSQKEQNKKLKTKRATTNLAVDLGKTQRLKRRVRLCFLVLLLCIRVWENVHNQVMNRVSILREYDGEEDVWKGDFMQDRTVEQVVERVLRVDGETNVTLVLKPLDKAALKARQDQIRATCEGTVFETPGYMDGMCLLADANHVITMNGAPGIHIVNAYGVGTLGNQVILVSEEQITDEMLRGVRFFWGAVEAMRAWYPREFMVNYIIPQEEVIGVEEDWLPAPLPGGELPVMRFQRVMLGGSENLLVMHEDEGSDSEA
jgi:hypothetical protein